MPDPNPFDRVRMKHPDLPGVVKEVSRRAFGSHSKRGWTEVKSPAPRRAAKKSSAAADASKRSPSRRTTTASTSEETKS